MSNTIPEEVKQKIVVSAKEFCKKDNRPADVVISHADYSLSGLMTYHAGAEFGYSLSSKRIEELESDLDFCRRTGKEYDALVRDLKRQNKELEEEVKQLKGLYVTADEFKEMATTLDKPALNLIKKANIPFEKWGDNINGLIEAHFGLQKATVYKHISTEALNNNQSAKAD